MGRWTRFCRKVLTGWNMRSLGSWIYSWSRLGRMSRPPPERRRRLCVMKRCSGSLPLHQQIDAVIGDFVETQPVVQVPGRVEPLNVDLDLSGGRPGLGQHLGEQLGPDALAAVLGQQGDVQHLPYRRA